MPTEKTYEFAGFRFDTHRGLYFNDRRIHLTPKPRLALEVLLSRKGAAFAKDGLIDLVWPGEPVSDASLSRCIYQLRKALAHPDGIEIIETLYGQGFRISVEVRETVREPAANAGHGPAKTASVAAFEVWQHAREFMGRRAPDDLDMAIRWFRHAAELDPAYPPAWSSQAECHIVQAFRHYLPPREAARLGAAAARRALALNPGDPAALAAEAWIQGAVERQLQAALDKLDRAVRLDKFYWQAYQHRAWMLHALGRHDQALTDLGTALVLNPLASGSHTLYAWILLCTRRAEAALAHLQRAARLLPLDDSIRIALMLVLSRLGRHRPALEAGEPAIERAGRLPIWLAHIAHAKAVAGLAEEARVLLRETEAASRPAAPPTLLAPAYLALGEREQALLCLKRGFEEGCPWFPFSRYDPRLAVLATDPAYFDLSRQLPLPKSMGIIHARRVGESLPAAPPVLPMVSSGL